MIMFRNKTLLKTFFRYQQKFGLYNLPFGFSTTFSQTVFQSIFFKSLEVTELYKTFLFNRNFQKIRNNEKCTSQFSQISCWNCKETLKENNFTCSLCGALQPPKPNVNFFELLGVSQVFDIDLEDMTRKFRDLQRIFHPDKVANKSKEELEISETYSRLLNKAYTTLKDPVSRGFYLLKVHHISSKGSSLDQNFLSVIMEKNEELEAVDNINSLDQFLVANNELIEKQYSAVQTAFRNNKLADANLNLLKLNYLLNLNKKIKEKEMTFSSSNKG